jgi:hypothetical protein
MGIVELTLVFSTDTSLVLHKFEISGDEVLKKKIVHI